MEELKTDYLIGIPFLQRNKRADDARNNADTTCRTGRNVRARLRPIIA